jgi:Tol biopolymer transport system component
MPAGITRIDLSTNGPRRSEIMAGQIRFYCNAKGDFVYQDKTDKWFTGNIAKPDDTWEIVDPLKVSSGDEFLAVAVSHNGDRAVWTTLWGTVAIVDLKTGKSRIVRSIKASISPAAWAPDDSAIAYYRGGIRAEVDDLYGIVVLSLNDKIPNERLIAQPSSIFGKFRQSPPDWSPDGSQIYFEGRYKNVEHQSKDGVYVVNVKDRRLDGASISPLGDGIHAVEPWAKLPAAPGDRHWKYKITVLNTQTNAARSFVLNVGWLAARWNRDGTYLAISDSVQEDRSIYLFNSQNGVQVKVYDAHKTYVDDIYWIETKDDATQHNN